MNNDLSLELENNQSVPTTGEKTKHRIGKLIVPFTLLLGSLSTPSRSAEAESIPNFMLPLDCGVEFLIESYDTGYLTSDSTIRWSHANAVDLNIASGDDRGLPVYAGASGKVTSTNLTKGIVEITSSNGYRARYQHMTPLTDPDKNVVGEDGEKFAEGEVKIGDKIGYIGSRGAGNAHLHFEVFDSNGSQVQFTFGSKTIEYDRVLENSYDVSGVTIVNDKFDDTKWSRSCDETPSSPEASPNKLPDPTLDSRPSAIVFNNQLHVFLRGGDGKIYTQHWDGKKWSGYTSIGSNMEGDPEVLINGNAINIFSRGKDGLIYHNFNDGNGWNGWFPLGTTKMITNPQALNYTSTEINVFALRQDKTPYKRTLHTNSGWSNWTSMTNNMDSDLVPIKYGSTEMTVFARGNDDKMYKRTWNGKAWNGFDPLGSPTGGLSGNPEPVVYNNQLEIWSNTPSGCLFKRIWDKTKWQDWYNMGCGFEGTPELITYGGNLQVFAVGTDGKVYHRFYGNKEGKWFPFSSLGGNIVGDITVVRYGTELVVFGIGPDHKTYKNSFFPDKGWTGFSPLPG